MSEMPDIPEELLRSFLQDEPGQWQNPLLSACRDAARLSMPPIPELPQSLASRLQNQTLASQAASGGAPAGTGAVLAKLQTATLTAKLAGALALVTGLGVSAYLYTAHLQQKSEAEARRASIPEQQDNAPPIDPSREFHSIEELQAYFGRLETIILTDGRAFTGRVETLPNGNLRVQTTDGVIDIPASMIQKRRPLSPKGNESSF